MMMCLFPCLFRFVAIFFWGAAWFTMFHHGNREDTPSEEARNEEEVVGWCLARLSVTGKRRQNEEIFNCQIEVRLC